MIVCVHVTHPRWHRRRRFMRRWFLITASVMCLAVAALVGTEPVSAGDDKQAPVVPPRQGKSETIQLFNGKDLEGWEGYEDLWSVKDGVIVAKNTQPLAFSTYL